YPVDSYFSFEWPTSVFQAVFFGQFVTGSIVQPKDQPDNGKNQDQGQVPLLIHIPHDNCEYRNPNQKCVDSENHCREQEVFFTIEFHFWQPVNTSIISCSFRLGGTLKKRS